MSMKAPKLATYTCIVTPGAVSAMHFALQAVNQLLDEDPFYCRIVFCNTAKAFRSQSPRARISDTICSNKKISRIGLPLCPHAIHQP